MEDRNMCLFNIDTPLIEAGSCKANSPLRVSGWIIPTRHELSALKIAINDKPNAEATINLKRPDVALVFPNYQYSIWSGFAGEAFLDNFVNSTLTVTLTAQFGRLEEELIRFVVQVLGLEGIVKPRERAWNYSNILACPVCGASVHEDMYNFQCTGCKLSFEKRRGIPIFTEPGCIVGCKLLEKNTTNPCSEEYFSIIQETSPGLILDIGAGNPAESEQFPNMVLHEIVQYANTDVVSIYRRLPYKNSTFDAVISKAVFEHIPRPWEMADEIYRVLKPGGLIRVDTAFMYPLHGDPCHYFNMTEEGINEIFKRFELIESGVKNYQTSSWSLRAQIDVILDHIHSDELYKRFKELKDLMTEDFDNALDERGRKRLAAGVFFKGRKQV
jgi:SAM-dependent methyltransferase